MSLTPHRFARTLATLLHLSLPVAALGTAIAVPGCIFGSPGPSNVAVGKAYAPGEPTYDQFFAELYQVQLAMGQAPDREHAVLARLAQTVGLGADSTTDEIVANLERASARLAKAGVTLKLMTAGLEEGGSPTASLVTTGSTANPNDAALVAAFDQSAKEAAALLGEMRTAKPTIERLRNQPAALEPGIDDAFHKGGAPKKAEVRKNLGDAGRLIPLMATRDDDTTRELSLLLKKLEKVASTGPSPAAPVAAPPATEGDADATKPKKSKDAKPKASGAHTESTGGEAKAPDAKPAGKPKPPPSDDFEP